MYRTMKNTQPTILTSDETSLLILILILTGMQAFRYSGSINKITIAKAAGYMGIDVPKLNLPRQHLWCLQEKQGHQFFQVWM